MVAAHLQIPLTRRRQQSLYLRVSHKQASIAGAQRAHSALARATVGLLAGSIVQNLLIF